MKILFLTTHLNIGGITSYIVHLARNLRRRGHRVIVSSNGGAMVGELEKSGITHVPIPIKTKSELSPRMLLCLPEVVSIVRENGIDIVHANTRVTQVLGRAATIMPRRAYVSTCHGFFKKRLGRNLYPCWGDRVIAISDAVRDHLIKDFNVSPDSVDLIYNGVDTVRFSVDIPDSEKSLFKKSLGLGSGRVIGTIGRLSTVKGYGYLIQAFARLRRYRKGLKLLIVGEGPDKDRLGEIAGGLGVRHDVVFHRPAFDTVRLLAAIDIFVSSSIQEGLGLSMAEAMAAGKPVVATDVGGVSSLVKDRSTGILVKPRDPNSLAGAILSLLDNPDLAKKLASNGRRIVKKDFTIGGMADRILDVYDRCLRQVEPVMSNILIVGVNWLGDTLFTTPFIRAIKRKYPSARVTCLAPPRCRELLEGNPDVDEVLLYDEKGAHKGLRAKWLLIQQMRRKDFDGSYILHRSFSKALMVFLSGIKRRIGYDTKRRGALLTKAVKEPVCGLHKVEYFLYLAGEAGAPTDDKKYKFTVGPDDRKEADRLLREHGVRPEDTMIVVNPGGNWPPKRWPKERFAELASRLSRELGARVVVTGAPKDSALAGVIASDAGEGAVNAAGRTTLKGLGALMERADIVISSDSGPMHIAAGVGSKVIALFGPTSDALTGPYGGGEFRVLKKDVGCGVPCYDSTCSEYRCMRAISVDDVISEIKSLLDKI